MIGSEAEVDGVGFGCGDVKRNAHRGQNRSDRAFAEMWGAQTRSVNLSGERRSPVPGEGGGEAGECRCQTDQISTVRCTHDLGLVGQEGLMVQEERA